MPYTLTRADLASINDVEMAFSTNRLLPEWLDIPADFKSGNDYTKLAEAIFHDWPLPKQTIEFQHGFQDDAAAADLNKCIRAHLQSWSPKHEHKIAGVGFMISMVARFEPVVSL